MKIACIVAGSYIQIWDKHGISGPQKADDIFLGRFSSIAKKYAQEFYDGDYFYLTLKQGLLAPTDTVPSYEITKSASFKDPEAVTLECLRDQWRRFRLSEYDLIVFLGTKGYQVNGWTEVIDTLMGGHKDRLYLPLIEYAEENFGIAKIKDAMITGVPLFFPSTRCPARLRKIEVYQLFDQYDYPDLTLFNRERLTVLVAPNGFGKTTLMEMIYRVFSLKTADPEDLLHELQTVKDVPFGALRLVFDDGTAVTVLNGRNDNDHQGDWAQAGDTTFCLDDINGTDSDQARDLIEALPFIPTKSIKSSRLTEYSEYSIRKMAVREADNSLLLTFSDEIKSRIESLFSIYAEVAEDYECTAMARLTNIPDRVESFHRFLRKPYAVLSKEAAVDQLAELAAEREFLRSTGFLKVNQKLSLGPNPDKVTDDPELLKAITLHIKDSQEKYRLFKLLRDKIVLLQDIINDLFLDKTFNINYENGFEVIRRGKIIDITKLSSGEQHQVILYYDLIFNTEPGTLVLIDEPEISIHIEWQRQFLRNLQKISDAINCDFIVTTHSPDIVNDKWHLIVQLNEGPK